MTDKRTELPSQQDQVEYVLSHGWARAGSSGTRFRHKKTGMLGSLSTAYNLARLHDQERNP